METRKALLQQQVPARCLRHQKLSHQVQQIQIHRWRQLQLAPKHLHQHLEYLFQNLKLDFLHELSLDQEFRQI